MNAGYRPDYWDGVRSGENDGEEGFAPRSSMSWQPIDSAPKDGTAILGWCVHKADPYYDSESGCLTNYGARVEGLSHVEDGAHVLIWGEAYEVSDGWENPSFMMPAGWELSHDCEVMANPTHWMPIPAPGTGEQA